MSGNVEVLVRELNDSYVLITGGTSGIGFASAQKFAESGTPKVAINGRNEERGMAALEKLRKSFKTIRKFNLTLGGSGPPAPPPGLKSDQFSIKASLLSI